MTFGLSDFADAIQKSSFEACTSPPAVRQVFLRLFKMSKSESGRRLPLAALHPSKVRGRFQQLLLATPGRGRVREKDCVAGLNRPRRQGNAGSAEPRRHGEHDGRQAGWMESPLQQICHRRGHCSRMSPVTIACFSAGETKIVPSTSNESSALTQTALADCRLPTTTPRKRLTRPWLAKPPK